MKHIKNNRAEQIDIIFVFCLVAFGITITYQLTYLNSTDPLLHNLAELALGLGLLSLLGIGFTTFFALKGNIQIENFSLERREMPLPKFITLIDQNFLAPSSW